jgi:hypothetical protein
MNTLPNRGIGAVDGNAPGARRGSARPPAFVARAPHLGQNFAWCGITVVQLLHRICNHYRRRRRRGDYKTLNSFDRHCVAMTYLERVANN